MTQRPHFYKCLANDYPFLAIQGVFKRLKFYIKEDDKVYPYDFPNGIHFKIKGLDESADPKDLKRYRFGDYSFILGINNSGLLSVFYSKKLTVKKKLIDKIDTLTFAFLSEPNQ